MLAAALMSGALAAWAVPAASQVVAPSSAERTIKDPAEFDAYMQAERLTDPAARASAMEAFVAAYPRSVERVGALEQAMAAYQRQGDEAKVADAAQRILDDQPKNIRALAVITAIERERANAGDGSQLAAMRAHAETGLAELVAWKKPGDMGDETFKTLHDTMTVVFDGARAFALLQAKEFDAARSAYLKALDIDPSGLENAYQLGVTELQLRPVDVEGFWWLARAEDLAGAQHNGAVQQAVANYARGKYAAYHGSDDGWNDIVIDAADKPAPPDGFEVTAAGK